MPKKVRRKLNIFRLALLIVLLFTFIAAGAGVGFLAGVIHNLPKWTPGEIETELTTFVYDQNGKKIAELHGTENRIPVDFEIIPKHLKDAFLAIEDPHFYEHPGISLKAIARAAYVNLREGRFAQGGSTITQQLVKTAYLKNPKKTIKRKIQEALMAIQLERMYTKDQIFEMYLNQIYFGHGAYGVQAAAKTYFGKDVQDLTLGEAAMLAGLVRNPAAYSPFLNETAAKKRRAVVLAKMVEYGFIDEKEADIARAEKFNLVERKQKARYKYPYFIDHVIEEAEKILEQNGIESAQVYKGGLKIYTTLDPRIQETLQTVYQDPQYFPASNDKDRPVQSAMVILEPATGQIKALIGGREHVTKRGLNRATQMRRQPGSAIKPIAVYAPALEKGFTPATVIDDVPTEFPSVPKPYRPENYDGRWRGLITLREAVRWSVNVPAVKVLDAIGVETGYQFAKDLGLPLLPQDKHLSLALGGITEGVSPLELVAAYAAFANQGVYIEPYAITKITDNEGNVLYEHKPKRRIVMSEQTAYLMTDILKTVVESGTGWRAKMNRPVAGKTGTTQLPDRPEFKGLKGNRDAWFVGYTPELAGVVWMGYDITDKDHFLQRVYGGKYPAMIWKAVMSEALKDVPVRQFPRPEGIVTAAVDIKSGLLPSELTPEEFIRTEIFTKDTLPKEVSNVWVEAQVCAETGKLPTPFCPTVVTGVFLKRPVPYDGDVKPEDADLELPRELCDIHGPQAGSTVQVCTDSRHKGELVLANIPGPGEEGGCPPELIEEIIVQPGNYPSRYCDLPDHNIVQRSAAPPGDEPPARDKQAPPEPQLQAWVETSEDSSSGIQVRLTWTEPEEDRNYIYSIDRWTDSNPTKYNIGITTSNQFIDRKVEKDQIYHYRIFAIDPKTGLTSPSSEVTVETEIN
ncbi:transglycosylase domain-containing protein [Calderihabitans maritimus]|uniref:Penicillin-binding protein 1A n=1 Tax=Calderihabitans maritimus TaxID=1246530 RepID=A0A1Z5HRV8_9FIRM|nr:PBP1A family penicillin-binding protein [Calderihabitans maritimus]GAW92263.1 penicillin-binding protein 1A [Calderihabitans maritimus]